MAFNLQNRHFLKLDDFTPQEIGFLLHLSTELKAAKYAGTQEPRLKGKQIALIFEKDSTRTRSGFEVAAYDQGAHVTYIGPSGSHIGSTETIKDTAVSLAACTTALSFAALLKKRQKNWPDTLGYRCGMASPIKPIQPRFWRTSHHAGAQPQADGGGLFLLPWRCRI